MTPVTVHVDGLIYARQAHGGISRNFTNLINAFAERPDIEVELCLEAGLPFPEGMAVVPTRQIPGDLRIRPSRLFGRLASRLSERRRRAFWSSATDGVFHSSFYSSPDGVSAPQLLSMHDTIFEDFPGLFNTERHRRHLRDKALAFQRCDALVFPSAFTHARTLEHYDCTGKLARVIPHAIDAGFRLRPADAEIAEFAREVAGGRPFLLHVGSRYLHKNVGRLLEAYARWNDRDAFALVLAGGGPLDEQERTQIDALGLADLVRVVPRLSDAGLLCAYHAATAFVFPSLSEGFGFPVLEALACGCPTACSDAASLPEVAGEAAVYFDPTDVDAILGALDRIVASSGDRPRWLSARANALRRTWAEVATEYVDLYRGVVAHPRSQAN